MKKLIKMKKKVPVIVFILFILTSLIYKDTKNASTKMEKNIIP